LEENNVDLSSIKFFHVPTNDIWVRDFGPTTVLMGENSTPVFIWNPYVPLGLPGMLNDENVGAALAMYLNVPVYRLPVIVEGGNIITDGKGTIMMMESVLDNNAQVNREGLKEIMKSYLGAENLVTFPAVPGEACGHIDMIVKFIDEDTLIVAEVSNDHPWYNSLEDIAETLSDMTASNGEPYEIVRIMLPETVDDVQEWTYVNSLILNNKVIVPVYGTPEDEIALNVYQEIMPEYEIVSVDESNYAAGAIHCQAKEVPKSLVDQIS
ncbi:MAG: agmatine deiminase family protein, partial [Nanoarchaeota archaeon]|nr:agmatine deiminase family protein [Nanoarchaeota archaeon]